VKSALLDLGQQFVRALEGLDPADELVELLHPRLAQDVPVRLLDVPAADLGHKRVSPPIPMPRRMRHIGR
jgi:hypothetical protein